MTTRRKHHYIPRFYLKRFSINEEGKVIGLYNHKNDVFVQNAPLKSQAYEDFLYGRDDDVENALANLENAIAKMFYYWIDGGALYLPPVDSLAFTALKRFILYQFYRIPKTGDDIVESANLAFNSVKHFSVQRKILERT